MMSPLKVSYLFFGSNFFAWFSAFFTLPFSFFQGRGIVRSYTLAGQYGKEAVKHHRPTEIHWSKSHRKF